MLERVTLDKKDWKPHAKSMSIGRLSTHVAETTHWISNIIRFDIFDFEKHPFTSHTTATQQELMIIFQKNLG